MEEVTAVPGPQARAPKPKGKMLTVMFVIVALILLGTVGYLLWQWSLLSTDNSKLQSDKQNLQSQVDSLTKQLADAKKTAIENPAKTCDGTITASLKSNIHDAISSKNTAALEGYMASSVTVVIAASEKGGAESPAKAVADLDYLSAGTAPWDFNLSTTTLNTYKAGFYKDYFGTKAYVGKSANSYVVSFDFDDCAKIKTVFMAVNEDLLK
jgi:hypothetical protein